MFILPSLLDASVIPSFFLLYSSLKDNVLFVGVQGIMALIKLSGGMTVWSGTKRPCISVRNGTAALELESIDKQFDVNVRWDGCMEMHV